MARNRSLDEFAGGDDADAARTHPGESTATGDDESPAADPLPATYAWDPGGGRCDGCGVTAEVRWRDEAGLVCPDCKAW